MMGEVCVDLCEMIKCCWWWYTLPDLECGTRCCGPYGPNLDKGCNLSEKPIGEFKAWDDSDPPNLIWQQQGGSWMPGTENCTVYFDIIPLSGGQGTAMQAVLSQGVDGGRWVVFPRAGGAGPSYESPEGSEPCGFRTISLLPTGGGTGNASFQLYSQSGECISPPCGPDDNRYGAAITISGFGDCIDDGPGTFPNDCQGQLRPLASLNQTVLVPAPAILPALVEVTIDNFAITCDPGVCRYNYQMRFEVTFGCVDPGDGDTLGYDAKLFMDGIPIIEPPGGTMPFEDRETDVTAGIGCCREKPQGGYFKEDVNFKVNWGFF